MGTAHLFGYTLTFNFNMPYSAANIADFWRRWHISLSSWIRDYIFIPLGGSRGGEWATSRNLMIAMTLGGLWHGANWTFVIWGMLHGGLLVGHRLFRRFAGTRPLLARMLESYPGTVVRIAVTFAVVSLGWVLFRSPDLNTAGTVYRRLIALQVGASGPVPLKIFVVLGGVVIAAHLLGRSGLGWYLHRKLPAPLVGFGYAAALILGMTIAPAAGQAFIYFQF